MDTHLEHHEHVDVPRMKVLPKPLSRRALLRIAFAGVVIEECGDQRIVKAYKPKVEGGINDLEVDAKRLLLGIPCVVDVQRTPAKQKPKRRIVHILDWHWISEEDFAEEQKRIEEIPALTAEYLKKREDVMVNNMPKGGLLILGGGHDLNDNCGDDCEYLRVEMKSYATCGISAESARTAEEIAARYEQFLKEVEAVQADQRVVLRCLARHHGLEHVYLQELTSLTQALFLRRVGVVRHPEKYHEDFVRGARLQIGAAGQLLAGGVLREVRPVDDFFLLLEGMERKKK